jgi:hypothetical protein
LKGRKEARIFKHRETLMDNLRMYIGAKDVIRNNEVM